MANGLLGGDARRDVRRGVWRHLRLVLGGAALATVAACGSGGPTAIEPGPGTGPLTAYIDDAPFIATVASSIQRPTGIVITASAGGTAMRFEFPNNGARNYLIGPGNEVSATVTIGTASWQAEEAIGSGTITVTDILPSFISGSFSITLKGTSTEGTLRVRRGLFVIIG